MEMFNAIWLSAQESVVTALPVILGYLPSLFGGLSILIVGWLIARFVRAAATKILNGLNRVLERTFQSGILASARVPLGASTIFGNVMFWVIVFVTLTIAAQVARLPAISRWLHDIALYLPDLLLGGMTIAIGYLLSGIIGDQVAEAGRTAKSPHAATFGRIAQGVVIIIAAIIGFSQIGVDVTFLVTVASVAVGAILLGFSIAFGFGSRAYVSNLISARAVRQNLSLGHLVRIGETEGEVLEITQTHIAIDTEKGRALIPAHLAEASGMVIISHHAPVESEGS